MTDSTHDDTVTLCMCECSRMVNKEVHTCMIPVLLAATPISEMLIVMGNGPGWRSKSGT